MTPAVLAAYCQHRLYGLMHLTNRIGRWWNNQCEAVNLAMIAQTHAAPTQLSGAVAEYMQIERHAQLSQWVDTHCDWPTVRMRSATSLIVEFRDEWQTDATRLKLEHARHVAQPALAPMNGIQLVMRVWHDTELPDVTQLVEGSPFVSEVSEAILAPLRADTGKPWTPAQLIHGGMRVKISQSLSPAGTYQFLLDPIHSRHDAPYVFGGRSLVPSDACALCA
jgi:hypothetical protein